MKKEIERSVAKRINRQMSVGGVVMPKSVLLLQMMDLLQERPGLNISQLAAELDRSERTIYRYLEALSAELHVPVYCDLGGYFVAERVVPSNLDLLPKEILAIRLALTSGPMQRGGPFGDFALSAWKKIESALSSDSMESVRAALNRNSISIPSFTTYEAETNIIRCVSSAVERNRQLSIIYCSHRSGEVKPLIINPYALLFRRHNWYIIAHSQSHGKLIQLKLIRIIKAEETGKTFQLPNDFSIDSFYAKSWEMWTGGEETLVRVRFSPRVADIIRESKRHPTQQLEDTKDGGVIFSVRVAGTEEIGFWILSYGADAEVLDPPELRERIEEAASRMVSMYSDDILSDAPINIPEKLNRF